MSSVDVALYGHITAALDAPLLAEALAARASLLRLHGEVAARVHEAEARSGGAVGGGSHVGNVFHAAAAARAAEREAARARGGAPAPRSWWERRGSDMVVLLAVVVVFGLIVYRARHPLDPEELKRERESLSADFDD
jgi:hypothetical protein